jgi:hypothetical protein
MSGIMLNLVGGTFGNRPPSVIGQAYGGGFYAGQIGVSSVATHYIIVGPKSTAQTTAQWKNVNTATPGADSVIDGPQNTADMVADGNATVYPAAHFCNDLSTGGQTDWYMPALNELEICYYNLKPTANSNNTAYGINPNAVPARASNYTSSDPPKTSATIFQGPPDSGTENFAILPYWASTESSATQAWYIDFRNGYTRSTQVKDVGAGQLIRAIRRVPV